LNKKLGFGRSDQKVADISSTLIRGNDGLRVRLLHSQVQHTVFCTNAEHQKHQQLVK